MDSPEAVAQYVLSVYFIDFVKFLGEVPLWRVVAQNVLYSIPDAEATS
jgi:hypothetical protein